MSDKPAPESTGAVEPEYKIFKLRKPVQAHGEDVTELKAREPSGADIINAGNPVIINFDKSSPEIRFDDQRMAMMISLLCSVPMSTVRKLDPKDYTTVAYGLAGFFIPDMAQI